MPSAFCWRRPRSRRSRTERIVSGSPAIAPKSGACRLDRLPKRVSSAEDVEGRVEALDHGPLVAPRRLRDDEGEGTVLVHPAGEGGLIY